MLSFTAFISRLPIYKKLWTILQFWKQCCERMPNWVLTRYKNKNQWKHDFSYSLACSYIPIYTFVFQKWKIIDMHTTIPFLSHCTKMVTFKNHQEIVVASIFLGNREKKEQVHLSRLDWLPQAAFQYPEVSSFVVWLKFYSSLFKLQILVEHTC